MLAGAERITSITRMYATDIAANVANADAGCPHGCNPHLTGHVREGHSEQWAATLRHCRRHGYARHPWCTTIRRAGTARDGANELVAEIHDRMPLILAPGDYVRWLSDKPDPGDLLPGVPGRADAHVADIDARE